MIFMSQSGLTDPSREKAWAAWYADHVRIMVTVQGITSAQRFATTAPGHPPSLAMYSVASAAVFDDPYYRSIRGMGEWQPLIDTRHYHRNLFSGLDVAPDVPEGAVLIVADRDRPTEIPRLALIWLTAVGLDRSTPYRGIAVVDTETADALASHDVAVYRTNGRRVSAR
jgi:hypothetical protein